MRLIVIGLLVAAIAQSVLAQDPEKLREARAAAEAVVRPSGPVRLASSTYTPVEWRPAQSLAGTYRDVEARHRFTRHTYGWPGWWWYSYRCWHARPYGFYRCW